MNADHDQRREVLVATLLYVALTIALTWPLARGLTRDIPGDFGDPLFTSWVIAWDATHLGPGWLHGNIFYPHPLSLAYSETFLPQALQVLPIYAATKNPILCYNLLFLSTFVLSGLGMFLFGRELTGSRTAGFVAGLAYAFAPYRIASLPHLQVLSAAWLPFVLFGLRHHFTTGRVRPLAGAVLAWVAQNLSCGYYLLFFSPAIVLYIVWEIATRGLWSDRRTLARVVAAIATVFIATVPFVLPYLDLRSLGFGPRSLIETRKFSADVYAYFTADPNLRVWGSIAQAWPRAEGLLFPGLTITALAILAVTAAWRQARHSSRRAVGVLLAARALSWLLAASCTFLVLLLLGHSIRLSFVKITSFSRLAWTATAIACALLATSQRARLTARGWLTSPVGIFSALTLFAVVMSFGPDIHARGRAVTETNIYAAFYHLVPGFDGLRVPSRYGMLVTLGLATLAALGIAELERGNQRAAGPAQNVRNVGRVAALLIVLESIAVPIPINQNSIDYKRAGLAPLPPSVSVGAGLPDVYRFIAQLPAATVIVELPLGEPAFDIRYMFYSTTHWKPLVNGYSGGAPQEYEFLSESLEDAATRPDGAWDALTASRATHAVVHEGFYTGDRGSRLSNWIRARGGNEVAAFGSDHVFQLPNR